jgi:hypothetical protein
MGASPNPYLFILGFKYFFTLDFLILMKKDPPLVIQRYLVRKSFSIDPFQILSSIAKSKRVGGF